MVERRAEEEREEKLEFQEIEPAQGIVLQLVLLFVSNRDSTGKDKKDNES